MQLGNGFADASESAIQRWAEQRPEEWLAVRRDLGRKHLLPFTQWTFPSFQQSWHHALICDHLDLVLRGAIKRLMIFAPPRHTKTELFQRRFPAMVAGVQPEWKTVGTAYSSDLAEQNCRDIQAIIDHPNYRDLYPATLLPTPGKKREGRRKDNIFDIRGHTGSYRAVGRGGPLTGHGFNLGLIDDPVKNREEAESSTIRDSIYAWYTSTFYTRMDAENAAIVLSCTRWHDEDLAGKLLSTMRSDPGADQWTVVELPAILLDETLRAAGDQRRIGEALWPGRFSVTHLNRVKQNIGSYDWNSMYLQRPTLKGGAKIPVGQLQIIDRADLPVGVKWAFFIDLAVSMKTSADHTAMGFVGMDRIGNTYVRDVLWGRWEWPDVKNMMITKLESEHARGWRGPAGFEKAGQQEGFIDDLNRDSRLRKLPITIQHVVPDKDKLTRALPWIAKVENSQMHLVNGPWVNDYVSECSRFTGTDGDQDDQVDMTSGGYEMISKHSASTAELMKQAQERGQQLPSY